MKFKAGLYRNYAKKIFRTPSRMILTLSGLILSIMILMIGLIFSETYLNSKMSDIDNYYSNNAFVVEGEVEYELYNALSDVNDSACNIELISKYKYDVGEISLKEKTINIFIKDVRTNTVSCSFLSNAEDDYGRYSAELKAGRLIDNADIENNANVAVIGEGLAEILFGEETPIGQKITFPIYSYEEDEGVMQIAYLEELQVIGVISESDTVMENIKKALEESSSTIELDFMVYVPLSYVPADKKVDDYTMRVTKYSDAEEYASNVEKYEELVWQAGEYFETTSYYSLKENIRTEIEQINQIVFYIVIFMFVISGLCIVNTMFFSVKERINEIGIRKAVGAFDEDIVSQFVFEGLIYGVVAAIIGNMSSILVSSIIFILIGGYETWNTNLCISIEMIMLSTLVSMLIGVIASIIPSVYASKIKITQAINFD